MANKKHNLCSFTLCSARRSLTLKESEPVFIRKKKYVYDLTTNDDGKEATIPLTREKLVEIYEKIGSILEKNKA